MTTPVASDFRVVPNFSEVAAFANYLEERAKKFERVRENSTCIYDEEDAKIDRDVSDLLARLWGYMIAKGIVDAVPTVSRDRSN